MQSDAWKRLRQNKTFPNGNKICAQYRISGLDFVVPTIQDSRQKDCFSTEKQKGVLSYAMLVNQPESPCDPSGVFQKMPLIWCYKLYFRVVNSFWLCFNLLLVLNVGHNMVMQLCRFVSYTPVASKRTEVIRQHQYINSSNAQSKCFCMFQIFGCLMTEREI